MSEYVAPEEKLLRLIRGQKKPVVLGDLPKKQSAQEKVKKEFGFVLNLTKIKNFSLGIFILSSLIFLLLLNWPAYTPKELVHQAVVIKQVALDIEKNKADAGEDLDKYLAGAEKKQIFLLSSKTENAQVAAIAASELLKDLSLLGVITGDDPQAVVEDKLSQKTYYLKEGQFVREFKLKKIGEAKIILEYGGDEFELHL